MDMFVSLPAWKRQVSAVLAVLALFSVAPAIAGEAPLLGSVEEYQARYRLDDIFQKLVDNRGQGYTDLYGTRNLRAVLNGIVYRGGANNVYHNTHPRSNMNPLPTDGLQNLCEEGFTSAVYLYPNNFSTAPKVTTCRLKDGSTNQLRYLQKSPLSSTQARDEVVKIVNDKLLGGDPRPLYLHCWNGWHASGYISAILLRQFCGMSSATAVDYWNRNTDGNNGSSYEPIRKKIRDYKPNAQYTIGADVKAKICPN